MKLGAGAWKKILFIMACGVRQRVTSDSFTFHPFLCIERVDTLEKSMKKSKKFSFN
jgi:hypothetical protein